ncbi:MAG: cytochrome c [Bacteroidota bacterium]
MKNQLFVFLAILAVVFACGGKGDSEKTATSNSSEPTAIDGKVIYRKRCIICHGVKGDMGASGAFNLATSELTLEERILVVTKGRKTMASFEGKLTEKEIEAVAAYTLTLKK